MAVCWIIHSFVLCNISLKRWIHFSWICFCQLVVEENSWPTCMVQWCCLPPWYLWWLHFLYIRREKSMQSLSSVNHFNELACFSQFWRHALFRSPFCWQGSLFGPHFTKNWVPVMTNLSPHGIWLLWIRLPSSKLWLDCREMISLGGFSFSFYNFFN